MASLKAGQSFASLAAATSANGTTRNGSYIALNGVRPGSLSIEFIVTIVTGSVVATCQLQVSKDASAWRTVYPLNDPTFTTVTATDNRALVGIGDLSGWNYVRATSLLSGASTASGDTTAVNIIYQQYGVNNDA